MLAIAAVAPLVLKPTYAATPRETTMISVAELAQAVDRQDPSLLILYVAPPQTYAAGHIPGSRPIDQAGFMLQVDPHSGLHSEMVSDETLHDTLEALGVTPQSRIVLVGAETNYSGPGRVYLTLTHAGFGSNTRVLDGGMRAWIAAGRPTTTTATAPAARSTLPALKPVTVIVNAAYVQAHEHVPGTVILDVRMAEAWQGLQAATMGTANAPRYGHIPGALSLPYEGLWNNATAMLRPAAEIEAAFTDAGVHPGDDVVAYCWVGLRANATLLAAATLGHRIYLYDGSMEDWTNRHLPLEMPGKTGAFWPTLDFAR